MKKALFLMLGCMISFAAVGQELNSYKYVMVPEEYDFTKEPDMFQLNSLTKFLFDKYGFEAYMEGEDLPEDLRSNRCNALIADVENQSGLFVTKLVVVLKDCQNRQVFVSEAGRSREKDFKTAYQEALRDAFLSIAALNYRYQPTDPLEDSTVIVSAVPSKAEPIQDRTVEVSAVPVAYEKEEDSIVEVSAIPLDPMKTDVPEKSIEKEDVRTPEEMTFSMGQGIYSLKKSGAGYNLFQKGMVEPFASLIASKNNDSFIYASITAQGIANFDKKGNLVVEILDKETNSIEIRVYVKQN